MSQKMNFAVHCLQHSGNPKLVKKNSISLQGKFDISLDRNYKNSSGDEIANVNFLRRYGTYVLQNTKKENLLRLTN